MILNPLLSDILKTFLLILILVVVSFYFVTSLCRLCTQLPGVWVVNREWHGHHWETIDAFDSGTYCNVCNTNVFCGAECDYCGIVVDFACLRQVCSRLPCKRFAQDEELVHQWVHGNVPLNSMCFICKKDCGYGPGLVDYRCCWCQRVVHDACLLRAVGNCDLGMFKNFIIPPQCITVKHSHWRPNKRCTVTEIHRPECIDNWTPAFVLTNRLSGSGEGHKVLRSFRRLLNPLQVIDVCNEKLSEALNVLRHLDSAVECYILVAGGDGTFGWVLECIEEMQSAGPNFPRCVLALLPLGTGNDLSRVLGWVAGDPALLNGESTLWTMSRAKPVLLDRWTVKIVNHHKFGVNRPVVNKRMSNYFSVGVDALVTYNFHEKRKSLPRVLSGRLINKCLFFTYGTKDVLERMCKNLHQYVELQLDGLPIELPYLEAIVVLNIPCWGGGVRPWQLGRSGPRQSMSDGILEVFGVCSSFHIAQMQVGLSEPYRIGQAKEVTIRIKEGLFPVQIDGEPWQQGASTITLTHYGQSTVLSSQWEPQRRGSLGSVKFGLF